MQRAKSVEMFIIIKKNITSTQIQFKQIVITYSIKLLSSTKTHKKT